MALRELFSLLGSYLFDDPWSILHLGLGVVTRLLGPYGALICAAFIVYELREKERIIYKIGDFIEYMLGYLLCDTILG